MLGSDTRPRTLSSDETGLQGKAGLTFNTSDVSGNATINNVGGHIIHGDYTVQQIDSEKVVKPSPEEVHRWLAAPDSSGNYYAAREKHQAQTGAWFLDGQQYSAWKVTPDRPLCVTGDPGCGKTIICSSVIENILLKYEEHESVGVAYFFFDNRSGQSDLSMHEKMLRSMISQLFDQAQVEIPAPLLKIYGKGHRQPSITSLEVALRSIIDGFEHVFMIIDALDECADRGKLLQWIKTISHWRGGKLHLMLSSRQEPAIESLFKLLERLDIVQFGQHGENLDIQTYIEEKVATQDQWDDALRVIVKSTLIKGAGGMFRWVDLQLEELINCLTRKDLEDRLLALPKGLEEAYERMLQRSSRYADLKTFLQWMAFSASPLTVSQMADTIAVDLAAIDGPVYDPKRRYMNAREVLTVCSGFITESQGTVRLAHMSVKDFLVSDSIRRGAAAGFSIDERLSHLLICQTCLVFLLHLDTLESLPRITDNNLALTRYAAKHWTTHFHGTMESSSVTLETLLAKLFSSPSEPLRNSIRLHDPEMPHSPNLDRPSTDVHSAIYYAALANFHSITHALIDVRRQLLEASRAGQYSIVKSLLDEGAEVNYQIPRHVTSNRRYSSVDNLLLEEQTPLYAASYSGHLSIVRLLLERGAYVNYRGAQQCRTALHIASQQGRIAVVEYLLNHGATVNIRGDPACGTALHVASFHGHAAIVEILLDGGADINAGENLDTALHAASVSFDDDAALTGMLLDRGADINTKVNYRTALRTAASRGHVTIVEILLDRGAEGRSHGPALHAASFCGHVAVVKMLLNRGADTIAGGYHCAALHASISEGHFTIVKMLLDQGADRNVRGRYKDIALHTASSKGYLVIVEMLLDRGADANALGPFGGTALHAASSNGHAAIVKMLLDRGADANAVGPNEEPALRAASSRGHAEIVELLLDQGADANVKPSWGMTALQSARAGDHYTVVKLLMRNGAKHESDVGGSACL